MNALREAQKTRAVRLYRHALKNQLSWAVQREFFFGRIHGETREMFEANRNVTDVATIESLLAKGEQTLEANRHPDPYTVPAYVGGSKYSRNPPVPPSIHVALDFGREI